MERKEIDRINEIKFLELCTRIYAITNSTDTIQNILKDILKYIKDCSTPIILDLAKEIFDLKYVPQKWEIIYTLLADGMSKAEISRKIHMARSSVYYKLDKNKVLYPRATNLQLKELSIFIPQYERLFNIDMSNLL